MSSSTASDQSAAPAAAPAAAPVERGPVVIEVRGLEKAFRVPEHRIDTFRERATHPFTRLQYRELHALRGVSFDVHKGEFFGIVGQNGSGKSTLLKVLASIYKVDAGTIRMAGRLTPFIELGVGFNPELTARENVEINGVLLGLSRREARCRLDAVLAFAELGDFVELKLKNYSSGMMVRLAFAIMVQADADIMLVDEVLAVGDVAFAQKCLDVFREKRSAGKTILLVTHDMTTVQSLCHRAMLIREGAIEYIGDPEETAMRYYRLNFPAGDPKKGKDPTPAAPQMITRLVEVAIRNVAGERIKDVEHREPIDLEVVIEARQELIAPVFTLEVMNADSVVVFEVMRGLDERSNRLSPGDRVRVSGRIEQSLVPGRYYIDCWVRQDHHRGAMAVQGLRLLDFVVNGNATSRGVVSVDSDLEVVAEPRNAE